MHPVSHAEAAVSGLQQARRDVSLTPLPIDPFADIARAMLGADAPAAERLQRAQRLLEELLATVFGTPPSANPAPVAPVARPNLALVPGTGAARGTAPFAADALTAREREVLALVAGGASNKRIALRLGLSVHTVKRHVANILDKLGVHGRGEAAALYLRG